MTNPKALKELATALEIDVADVPDKNVAVLNAIAENYQGEGSAETIPEALENIAAVADNIGSKPEGTINITTNGDKDVAQYATAHVAVPASAVVSGTKSITANGTVDVTNYASANVNVASGMKFGKITITNNSGTPLYVRSFTDATQVGAHYPYGWEQVTIASGSSNSAIGVLLEEEVAQSQFRASSVNQINCNASVTLTASTNGSNNSATVASLASGAWALRVISERKTSILNTSLMTVTIAAQA